MQVLELKGYKSLRALNAFHTLMLGLKMLPLYVGVSYEAFYAEMQEKSDAEKETMIREAALFVELQPEEVEAMASFCCDPNGVPYSAANLKSLGPEKLVEIIVAVSMAMTKIKIDIVSAEEKKKSGTTL